MTLLQRTLPSILCCVIAVGYAPAWLHVSVCHDHHAVGSDGGNADLPCLHRCGHSHSDATGIPGDEALTDTDEQPSGHGHDSETCFVCQSLGNANGLTLQWDTPLQSTRLCEPVFTPGEFALVGPSLSIAQPRGPPARV
ncbi:MAG: DUF2946 domain-containing protein [Rubripirellula sp.]